MKKALKIFLVVLAVAAIIFFGFVPQMIDKSMNVVSKKPPFPKQKYYDSIPFIADLHCDALLWDRNFLQKNDHGHVDLPRMIEGNMAMQVFSIVSKTPRGINIENNDDHTDQVALLSFAQLRNPADWFSIKTRALHQCEALHDFAKSSDGKFRVIKTKKDLQKYISDRQNNHSITAGMLGIEGAHCLENDLNNLDEFGKAGVRYIGLTHFFDNEWAGSAHGIKKEGLTEKGKQLIKQMAEAHIMIDLAHASQKTISDVLKYHNGPVVVSHTGVKGVCDNNRNLTDAQIIEIGKHNGIIGIGLWETAVCGTDAAATAKSIRYVADKIGVDKVALGSDFDGAIGTHFDVTGLPEIVAALEKQGFVRAEIEKIMGGNIRDFFLRNLPN